MKLWEYGEKTWVRNKGFMKGFGHFYPEDYKLDPNLGTIHFKHGSGVRVIVRRVR